MPEETAFKEWVVLELMGHRRLAGLLSEVQIGGASFIRIDIPGENDTNVTQFYSPQAVYCITPTTEEVAREIAKVSRPAPVNRWELISLTGDKDTVEEGDSGENDDLG